MSTTTIGVALMMCAAGGELSDALSPRLAVSSRVLSAAFALLAFAGAILTLSAGA